MARPRSLTPKPWILLTLGPMLILALVVALESQSGRSIASWVLKSNSNQWNHSNGGKVKVGISNLGNQTALDQDTHLHKSNGDAAEGEEEARAAVEDAALAKVQVETDSGEETATGSLQQWKLMHSMMYWAHANPVPKPSHGRLFPASDEPQYITWEQDFAGMNNVRYQVEVLVVMAHLFRRTLVMPDHLAGAMDHLGDVGGGHNTIFDMFDHRDLATWIPVITMQQYLDARGIPEDHDMRQDTGLLLDYLRGPEHDDTVFPDWDANSDVMPVPNEEAVQGRRDPDWKAFSGRANRVVTYTKEFQQARTMHFKVEGDRFRLFGNCAGFWYWPSQAWQDYYMAGMRDHFHFHHDIVANASRIVHHLRQRYGGRAFNALHDRTDDFRDQFPSFYVDETVLAEHVALVMGDSGLPLYVAAAKINESRYEPLRRAFPEVIFLRDFVDEVLPGLPKLYLGAVEQMVCSVAARFVGTFGSTFSAYIHRLRGHHQPALVPDKGVYYTNFPYPDPEQYAASVRDNEPWADIVWWPTDGRPRFDNALWAREFSLTWNFSRSELKRDGNVFEPARRRWRRQRLRSHRLS